MLFIFIIFFAIARVFPQANTTCISCICVVPSSLFCPNITIPESTSTTTTIITTIFPSTTKTILPTTKIPIPTKKPLIYNELNCVFPFTMYGIVYDSCASFDNGTSFWCSLDSIYTTRAAQCNQSCPLLARNLVNELKEVHTSCLEPSMGSIGLFPDKNQTEFILKTHNRIRSLVKPSAANMKKITWDFGLARLAQRWAENCDFSHDCSLCRRLVNNKTISVGQNAFALLGAAYDSNTFWPEVINYWLREMKNFNYALGSRTGQFNDVGHYTQMVNSATSKIGCGAANCGGNLYAFCNYAPAQKEWIRPYKVGHACSQCSKDICEDNLCTCDKLCQNNGILDLMNCECKCLDNFKGSLCQIS